MLFLITNNLNILKYILVYHKDPFLVYCSSVKEDINDLITALNYLRYADDTTIYFNLEDFDFRNTEKHINAEVEKVNTWLKLNKLSLNVQKTKFMVFHRKQKKSVRSMLQKITQ